MVVRGPDTHEIGRGLVAYDADDAEKIKGRSSPDVMAILGINGRAEMIHRDDLVMGRAAAYSAGLGQSAELLPATATIAGQSRPRPGSPAMPFRRLAKPGFPC